jgi:hypothetical protein
VSTVRKFAAIADVVVSIIYPPGGHTPEQAMMDGLS